MNSARAAKTWKTSLTCWVVVSRFSCSEVKPIPARPEFGDHVDEVLEAAAVAVERRDDEGVADVEEGVARLQFRAEGVLSGLLVREDLPASGGGEGVDLPVASVRRWTPARTHLDLGADKRFGNVEFWVAGRLRSVTHDPGIMSENGGRGFLNDPGF